MTDQPQLNLQQPETPEKLTFLGFLRVNFVAGLLLIAPAVITFYILEVTVTTLDKWLQGVIPPAYRPETLLNYNVPGVGLVAGFLLVLAIGLLARNFIGKRLVSWADSFFLSMPGVRSVYSAVKQVVETLSRNSSESFREVILVEYPRKGLWCLAFVTGRTKGHVQKSCEQDVVNVFLPTTPNPTSGFLLFVPKEDIIKLDMTVEQGLKMVISAGMVTPTMAEGKAALKEEKVAVIEEKSAEVNKESASS